MFYYKNVKFLFTHYPCRDLKVCVTSFSAIVDSAFYTEQLGYYMINLLADIKFLFKKKTDVSKTRRWRQRILSCLYSWLQQSVAFSIVYNATQR